LVNPIAERCVLLTATALTWLWVDLRDDHRALAGGKTVKRGRLILSERLQTVTALSPTMAQTATEKPLRNIWVAMRTTPLALWLIALGLFAFLFTKIYYFDAVPEWFDHAYEVGRLAQDLSVATLAAFIFFIVSYQLPFVIEQQRAGPHVIDFMRKIADLVKQPIREIYRMAQGENAELTDEAVTVDMVNDYFKKVSIPKVDFWLGKFTETDNKSREYITAVWRYSRFIDSVVLSVLSKLELSAYSRNLPMYRGVHGPNSGGGLDFLATDYHWQFKLAIQLSKLADELQVRYKVPTSYSI